MSEPRSSRYNHPRHYVSWPALILGLILGVTGGLYYTWNIAPVEQIDTAPWQLQKADRNAYVVALMLEYAHSGNLIDTINELINLRLPGDDPIQAVADIACDMASSGYVNNAAGLSAIRNIMIFYQGQGKAGCADDLIVMDIEPAATVQIVLPSPTPLPPATKTPTPQGESRPTSTSRPAASPTPAPQLAFDLLRTFSWCPETDAGIIEVRVLDFNGQGIAGERVRVRWADGESTFVTGLKPERGPGYADFQMERGQSYVVELPGLSNPTTDPVSADECFVQEGTTSIKSWEIIFRGG